MRVDKAGIYEMPMAEYQADPAPEPSLSAGTAHRLLTQSPLHAWHSNRRLNPSYMERQPEKFDPGSCAHALLLEGEAAIEVIAAPDWRTKAAQEARIAAREAGKIPVLARQMDESRQMAAVAKSAIAKLKDVVIHFSTGLFERVLVWQHGNIWCRARPDYMSDARSIMVDYKSTAGSAEPNAWIRNQMVPLGFDIQAVHYQEGNAATGGPEQSQWLFLVQENYQPYACSFVSLAPAMYEIAKRKLEKARQIWEHCVKSDKWHSYPQIVAYAEPTTWQMDQDELLRLQELGDKLEYLSV